MDKEKYFIDKDQSSHYYIIPLSKKEDWKKFNQLDEDDPKSWELPDYAIPVGGCISRVTFSNYEFI